METIVCPYCGLMFPGHTPRGTIGFKSLKELIDKYDWIVIREEDEDQHLHFACDKLECQSKLLEEWDSRTFVVKDLISHPSHYMMNGMETKDIIEACVKDPESAYQANVIKYITRYQHKGTPIQDLEKAKQYIDFIIELREKNGEC